MSINKLTFRKPFDAHRHLRDGAILEAIAPYTSQHFYAGIVMPNLKPPVVTKADAVAYRERIGKAMTAHGGTFNPLMTLYLTDNTDPEDVISAFETRTAAAVKLYPLHGTTNSEEAVTDISKVDGVLRAMESIGMPLLIHGERPQEPNGELVDHFDREALYVKNELQRILDKYPHLRISLEHISSAEAATVIQEQGFEDLVATVCPHHLAFDRRTTTYNQDGACMPIVKAARHKEALRNLVKSGCRWIRLGTDCAAHLESSKQMVQTACGCFTGPHAIPLYLGSFEEMGCLELFEDFASIRGPEFFNIPPADGLVTYVRERWELTGMVPVEGGGEIRPFLYRSPAECKSLHVKNQVLEWKLAA